MLALLLACASFVREATTIEDVDVMHTHEIDHGSQLTKSTDLAGRLPLSDSVRYFEAHSLNKRALRTRRGARLHAMQPDERVQLSIFSHGRYGNHYALSIVIFQEFHVFTRS